jgi:hypothetical protein
MSTVGKLDIWASPGRCGKPPVSVTVKIALVGRERRTMQLEARRLSVSIRFSGNSVRLFWMKVVGIAIFPAGAARVDWVRKLARSVRFKDSGALMMILPPVPSGFCEEVDADMVA